MRKTEETDKDRTTFTVKHVKGARVRVHGRKTKAKARGDFRPIPHGAFARHGVRLCDGAVVKRQLGKVAHEE
jgi:hypothetical protein